MILHTCRGMVALTKHFLCTTHEYVCLGLFTSDPLEKMFGKLQHCVYFEHVIKVHILYGGKLQDVGII